MKQGFSEGSTAGLSGTNEQRLRLRETGTTPAIPALTILYHPDVRRIGEWTPLSEIPLGREALVSRHFPEFSSPGNIAGAPLSDSHISRQPLRFGPGIQGGITLSLGESRTRVHVDRESVREDRHFPTAEVERGVVLELSERIVLLLHHHWNRPPEPVDRFGLVGESPGIARVRADIRRVADLDVPVLLRGETGTGKELVARAVHEASPRTGPFIAISLGAIPPSLVASELFGAVRGAFTGSLQSQEGYFRRAHGGTLFLDEVGEAPAEVQVMLLRALETREVHPLGSQNPVRVDVRVLAATDADLEARVSTGEFRAPLLHRLAGYEIWMPPLRERREDVGRLLATFLQRELEAIGESHRLAKEIWMPPRLVARLAAFDWPGNVRQLRNVVRQLVIGSRGLPRIEAGPAIERILQGGTDEDLEDSGSQPEPLSAPLVQRRRKPSDVSEAELLAALRAARWDLQAAAEQLGISRPSLYALIESSPHVRKAGDLSAEEISRCFADCGGDVEAMVDRLEVSRKALSRRLREMRLGG
jgi:two-component system, NtrC family, nitrogen regulation response regulator GlnG